LDADELEAELADLEAEELDNQLLEPAPVPATKAPMAAAAEPAMPSVPQRAAVKKARPLLLLGPTPLLCVCVC
jgi:charged multivesicular body protein 4/18S rRNA (guanine1575-N7)-methyltransferase